MVKTQGCCMICKKQKSCNSLVLYRNIGGSIMMGKRLKEVFGLILINITLVSGSLNAETVYADTQAKIEIEKTEMPLKICVDEENKKTVLQIVAAWKKIYKNNGVELR